MKGALEKVGVPVSLITIPSGQHGVTFGLAADDKRLTGVYMNITRWFDKHLKK